MFKISIRPKVIITISVLLLCLSHNAQATYMYSVGTYVPYFNKAQVSNSGETKKFELNPYFSLGTQMHLTSAHYFIPEVGYTHWLETATKIKKSMIFLHYNFTYIYTKHLILRYGMTTHWYRIKGDGGTVTLRNGDSYQEFKAPNKEVTTYFTTVNIGSEYFMKQSLSLRFDLNMMNINELENNAYNYLLTINFYR